MQLSSSILLRRFRAATAGVGVLLFAAACGGGDAGSGDGGAATPDEVDTEASATATEQELAAFTPPADSLLTPRQVEAYLRASLTQFDLIRNEMPRLHERAQRMEQREKEGGGGVLSGLRQLGDAGALVTEFGDLVGGSFTRSARAVGQNPAEMEWVRERMVEVSGYLAARPMIEASASAARSIKEQAESYRGQPGYTDQQIDEMIRTAEEMERSAAQEQQVSRAVLRNYEIVKQARPNVSDAMWTTVGLAGGGMGLLGLSGLTNPQDTTAARQLGEFRRVYTDALANRVSAGMEDTPPQAEQQS